MEKKINDLYSSIHKIYDSDGKNIYEWKEFLYEININKNKINNEIKSRLNQSFIDKNKIELTSDLIDFIIDYGSNSIIDLISDEKLLENFILLSENSSKELQKKVVFLIQKWALKFKDKNVYSIFKKYYDILKSNDIIFPENDYKMFTYDKYITEKEINETMILIKEILFQKNKYKTLVKNFYISIQNENPFLEKNKEIGGVRNFPYDKNYQTTEQNKNIDNNVGKNSLSLTTPEINLKGNIDNNIGKNSDIFETPDKELRNLDNNTIVKSKNENNKNIEFNQINIVNININDNQQLNEKNKYIFYCDKESVEENKFNDKSINSYIINQDENISNEIKSNKSSNIENYLNKTKPFTNKEINLNESLQDESKNNDNNFKYNNINNDNNLKYNNIINNNIINNNIPSDNIFNNKNIQENNNNNFDVEAFKQEVGNNIINVNNMILYFNIYNYYLYQEIMKIINQISSCEYLINNNKNNIYIVNIIEKLKMDLMQTCYRYECLISKQNIPKFYSSFFGNTSIYYFNKDVIINFNYNIINHNNENKNNNDLNMKGIIKGNKKNFFDLTKDKIINYFK